MTTPRYQLIDSNTPLFYHLVSCCVRGGWLCGRDKVTRRNYSHRKRWLVKRIFHLAKAFPLEIQAYAVMSNHFHLVVYYDPAAAESWSDDEVVDRWLLACPPKTGEGAADDKSIERLRLSWLADPERIQQMRRFLGSISMFMKQLKQPIARRANIEDGCKGHFFEQRFYSGALLSKKAVIAAMAYVDLNPIRAKLAKSVKEIRHASITERLARLENSSSRLDELLKPLVSGLDERRSHPLGVRLGDYVKKLEIAAAADNPATMTRSVQKWVQQIALLKRRQRMFGSAGLMRSWVRSRQWQLREIPLP